ncbi:hypothetical protein TrispH2_001370 [Trichoplax sp. H2]|nr:hypothetical protein TrispH2_001370 [Trichoplax sp. H2]|eukprot:RDD46139.1 hypothetical protein TrispH2_001370 [Trichoplax sp. H2]
MASSWHHSKNTEIGIIEELPKRTFRKISGDRSSNFETSGIVVDFRKLLVSERRIIDSISNRDLLHAIVGLYDICLPDVTPEVIYDCVCARFSKTVILLRDINDIKGSMIVNEQKEQNDCDVDDGGSTKSVDQVFRGEQRSIFTGIYSDSEESVLASSADSSESDNSEEENYSAGIDDFIEAARERRRMIADSTGGVLSTKLIGPECLLVGCATFERAYRRGNERVGQISLLAVRNRYRRCHIGKYLLEIIMNVNIMGEYDAIAAYVDDGAKDFFLNNGFTDDVLLNSRYKKYINHWINSTLMCYLPMVSAVNINNAGSLDEIVEECEKWRQKSLEAYQMQAGCMFKMVKEQTELIKDLEDRLSRKQQQLEYIEKEFTRYRQKVAVDSRELSRMTEDVERLHLSYNRSQNFVGKFGCRDEILKELRYPVEEFVKCMEQCMQSGSSVEVQEIYQVSENTKSKIQNNFDSCVNSFGDNASVLTLYYCGGKSGLKGILENGFTTEGKSYVVGHDKTIVHTVSVVSLR